jgi:hypothetical protein
VRVVRVVAMHRRSSRRFFLVRLVVLLTQFGMPTEQRIVLKVGVGIVFAAEGERKGK